MGTSEIRLVNDSFMSQFLSRSTSFTRSWLPAESGILCEAALLLNLPEVFIMSRLTPIPSNPHALWTLSCAPYILYTHAHFTTPP